MPLSQLDEGRARWIWDCVGKRHLSRAAPGASAGRVVDVGDGAAVKAWVEATAEELGGLDIAASNVSGFGVTSDETGWRPYQEAGRVMRGPRACQPDDSGGAPTLYPRDRC
jgi:hypothetical protein